MSLIVVGIVIAVAFGAFVLLPRRAGAHSAAMARRDVVDFGELLSESARGGGHKLGGYAGFTMRIRATATTANRCSSSTPTTA